jgi:hypothetical protein
MATNRKKRLATIFYGWLPTVKNGWQPYFYGWLPTIKTVGNHIFMVGYQP